MRIRSNILVLLATLAGAPAPGAADEPSPVWDRVRFSVEAVEEVASDTLVAVLFREHQAGQQREAAEEVNRTVTWALAEARKHTGVEVRTLGYQTSPVYRQNVVAGWRVRQSLRLESRSTEILSALVGILQARLAVEHMTYEVSREVHAAVEERLIERALAAFTTRADLVTRSLAKAGWRLVSVDVGTEGPPMPMVMRAMAMGAQTMEAGGIAPPSVEPGSQTLRVTATGEIELLAE